MTCFEILKKQLHEESVSFSSVQGTFFPHKQKVFILRLDGYYPADFNKMLLLMFSPEYVEDDKPSQTTKS